MSSTQVILFACSKCFSRHPFEELSPGQQLCKDCRGSFPVVKCTYCRSEFQQTSKGNTSAICRKCEHSVKQYGKPSPCAYCNIIAAFIGNKCQRCTHTEQKYGAPVACDQCKQRCAFDRHDENKKIDGKLLCWLCTLSFKRTVAKARQEHSHTPGLMSKKRPSTEKPGQMKENHKKMRSDSQKQALPEIPDKIVRNSGMSMDPNSSDHMIAMTQLKEQIASLQKRIIQKDRELLGKDKHITELKGKNFQSENELRVKLKDQEKHNENKLRVLSERVADLLQQVARLSKVKGNKVSASSAVSNNVTVTKDSGGSGTDSPNNGH